MAARSVSLRDAARELGLSAPTVVRLCEDGTLPCFLSPGGHRRIPCEAVEGFRAGGRGWASLASAPSGPLQSRRERIEELNLDGQELRARRELRRLQAEEGEEAEREAAEASVKEAEREERREQARAERLREERLAAESEAATQRARLREQVQVALSVAVPAEWPAEKHRALAEALDAELLRTNVADEESAFPIIRAVIDRFRVSWAAEARSIRLRERALDSAIRAIAWTPGSMEADELEAGKSVRQAFASLSPHASEREIRCAAEVAIAPIRERIEQKRRHKEIIEAGVSEIFPYLERLHRANGISRELLYDFAFRRDLESAVRLRLSADSAPQDPASVRRLVHEIVDAGLDVKT